MDTKAERIYRAMTGVYHLSELQMDEREIVKNEFEKDSYCSGESEREFAARIRVLDRLTGGADDPDIDEMVDATYNMEEYLVCKMHQYAVEVHTKEIIKDIFNQMYAYQMEQEQCDDPSVQLEYLYRMKGLLDAAVLITKVEVDDVKAMYDAFIKAKIDTLKDNV